MEGGYEPKKSNMKRDLSTESVAALGADAGCRLLAASCLLPAAALLYKHLGVGHVLWLCYIHTFSIKRLWTGSTLAANKHLPKGSGNLHKDRM